MDFYEDCFQGQTIAVRLIAKRNGIAYGIYRPGSPHAIIDEFGTMEFANLVAQYVEKAGGSYEASIRREAREFARKWS